MRGMVNECILLYNKFNPDWVPWPWHCLVILNSIKEQVYYLLSLHECLKILKKLLFKFCWLCFELIITFLYLNVYSQQVSCQRQSLFPIRQQQCKQYKNYLHGYLTEKQLTISTQYKLLFVIYYYSTSVYVIITSHTEKYWNFHSL